MALSTASARSSVKIRLGIPSATTTWDDQIDEFVLSGVKRLYPIAQKEVAKEETVVTVDDYGEAVIDLSTLTTPVTSVRKVESTTGYGFHPVDQYSHHGTELTVTDLDPSTTSLRIYGLTTYALTDVPEYLEQPVIWFAISEFYDYLAGDRSSYNVYMESGARSVDNMQDESTKYEQKANIYLNDRVTLYGLV